MVERSIAWIVRDNRKLRYRGTVKNDWWLRHRVAAINLKRLSRWVSTTSTVSG
jgi:hypothetical protein